MKYARCRLKNIGITIPKKDRDKDNPIAFWIEEVDELPNNCIRIIPDAGWCVDVCKECN